jgi:hypothetical protein
MAESNRQPGSSVAKIAIAYIGAAFFFVASIVLTLGARRSQVSGEPMSNGNGGTITAENGYKIAALMLLFSLIYGWRGWVLTKRRSA